MLGLLIKHLISTCHEIRYYVNPFMFLLKKGEIYFKSLALRTPQHFQRMLVYLSRILTNYFYWEKGGSKIFHVTLQYFTICYEGHFTYIETSQLIWRSNQLTGFYMRGTEGTQNIFYIIWGTANRGKTRLKLKFMMHKA